MIKVTSIEQIPQLQYNNKSLPTIDAIPLTYEFLCSIIDELPGYLYWKDIYSRYRGGNKNFIKAAGFDTLEQLNGKFDHELIWKNKANEFIKIDHQIMNKGNIVTTIDGVEVKSNKTGFSQMSFIQTTKQLILDKHGNRYILGYATEVESPWFKS